MKDALKQSFPTRAIPQIEVAQSRFISNFTRERLGPPSPPQERRQRYITPFAITLTLSNRASRSFFAQSASRSRGVRRPSDGRSFLSPGGIYRPSGQLEFWRPYEPRAPVRHKAQLQSPWQAQQSHGAPKSSFRQCPSGFLAFIFLAACFARHSLRILRTAGHSAILSIRQQMIAWLGAAVPSTRAKQRTPRVRFFMTAHLWHRGSETRQGQPVEVWIDSTAKRRRHQSGGIADERRCGRLLAGIPGRVPSTVCIDGYTCPTLAGPNPSHASLLQFQR